MRGIITEKKKDAVQVREGGERTSGSSQVPTQQRDCCRGVFPGQGNWLLTFSQGKKHCPKKGREDQRGL